MSEAAMAKRPLGRTGLLVSPMGLAAVSGGRLGPEDVERAFHEHGVNTFLLNARMKVLCEGVRRLVRAGHRDELVLVAEASLPFAGAVRRGLEGYLRLAGTDRIDAWLVAWVRSRWWLRGAVWSALVRLRDAGMARAVGFSSHERPLLAALGRELQADVLMVRYNAAHRGAEREVFDALADLGERRPGILAFTATRWGKLLRPLPARGFPDPMTGAECYRFVLGHPMVDTVWCAARTAAELAADVEGVRAGPLDPARLDEVRRFGDAVRDSARAGLSW